VPTAWGKTAQFELSLGLAIYNVSADQAAEDRRTSRHNPAKPPTTGPRCPQCSRICANQSPLLLQLQFWILQYVFIPRCFQSTCCKIILWDVITGDDTWRDEAVNRYQQQQQLCASEFGLRSHLRSHASRPHSARIVKKDLGGLDSFEAP